MRRRGIVGALIIAFGRPRLNQYPRSLVWRGKMGGQIHFRCSGDLTHGADDMNQATCERRCLVDAMRDTARVLTLSPRRKTPRPWKTSKTICRWLALIVGSLGVLAMATATRAAESMQRWERTEQHMGSAFTVVLYGTDERRANDSLRAAFERIQQLDASLSNYKTASELNRLCQGAPHEQPRVVSDDLFRVLQRADEASRQSDGAFDVTIGPLTRLWRQTRRTRVWPSSDRLKDAQAAVGFESIRLDDSRRTVQFMRSRMQLDLGGIGAGYAVDQIADLLMRRGFDRFLIDGSGDIRAAGAPPNRDAWRVAIGGLRRGDPEDAYLLLRDRSVATSGDLHQYFEFNGQRYSHLIDPQTGVGLTVPSSVTVIARDCVSADIWSSTVALMGIERGIERVREHPEWGLEVRATWLEGEQRRTRETAGFAAYCDERSPSDAGSVRSTN